MSGRDAGSARPSPAASHVALVLVLGLAAVVRVSSFASAHDTEGWRFRDGDSYAHLHRVEQTIRGGGRAPLFEPRLSHPDGMRIQMHAGYDLLVAGAVVVRCGGAPTRACLEETAAWSTPALGVLATFATWLLARSLLGTLTALLAAFLFAVYPFTAGAGALGHVDHHVLEPFCLALWFTLLALGRPALAGIAAGASLTIFPSALWPIGVSWGALALERLWRLRLARGSESTVARFAVGAALASVPVALTGAFPDRFEPSAASLFHVAALAAAALASIAVERFAAPAPHARVSRALAAMLAVSAVFIAALHEPLAALARFSRADGLWTGVVQQQPLAAGPGAALVLVLVVLAAGAAALARAARTGTRALAWLALTGVPLSLAGVAQMRLLMVASPALVTLLSLLLVDTGAALRNRLASARPHTRALGTLVTAAIALLLLAPLREYVSGHAASPRQDHLEDGIRLLERLGRDPNVGRGSSIFADWTWGHHVLYFTPLSTVASPFMLTGQDEANVLTREALAGESASALLAAMRARESRYLLVSSHFDAALAARSIGRPPPRRAVSDTLLARRLDGFDELRLADAEGGARLYERVPGAVLVGTALPGTPITARIRLRPAHAPSLERAFRTTASPSGRYEIRVPEWNTPERAGISADREYAIGACRVVVTAEDVRTKARIPLRCAPETDG